MGDPSDTAGWLAACCGGLQKLSGPPFTQDSVLLAKATGHHVREFSDAFSAAIVSTVPVLDTYRRADPIRHAGVSGSSFHELACLIALEQHQQLWLWANPEAYCAWCERRKSAPFEGLAGDELSAEAVVAGWDAVSEVLSSKFADVEPIDPQWLIAGIETERKTVSDGPAGVREWRHDGVVREGMPPLPWRFAKALHGAPERTLHVDAAINKANPDGNEFDREAVPGWQKKANSWFRQVGVPYHVEKADLHYKLTISEGS